MKFDDLYKTAKDLGADALVTGHYILTNEGKNGRQMFRAKDIEKEVMAAISNAIEKCRELTGYADILDSLEESQNQLYLKYPPRINQPETWRPQKAAQWTSKWMKILAKAHYNNLIRRNFCKLCIYNLRFFADIKPCPLRWSNTNRI